MFDGNYVDEIADLLWPAADTIVWLELPRHVAVRRAAQRSVRRARSKSVLWNGNRETVAVLTPWSIFRFIRGWPANSQRVARGLASLGIPENSVVRLRSDAEIAEWLAVVTPRAR